MYNVNTFLSVSLFSLVVFAFVLRSCSTESNAGQEERLIPTPDFTLTADQTHNKFSATIPPVLTVPSGTIIEAFTEEASDQQFELGSIGRRCCEPGLRAHSPAHGSCLC